MITTAEEAFVIRRPYEAFRCRRANCGTAFVLPIGAPGDAPPCIRQRPFVIAGNRHGIPLLVRAPHRGPGAWAIYFARGCSSNFD